MNAERRHRVSFTAKEVVAALKLARPGCLHTQAIPDVAKGATWAISGALVDFIWTKPDHATAEKE